MKERLLIVCVSIAAAYILFVAAGRFSAPTKPGGVSQASEAPPSRVYKDASGREVRIAMPLLDKFVYRGDGDLCTELPKMIKTNADAAGDLLEACDDLSTGTALEISQKHVALATILGDQDEEYTYSLSDNPIDRDKRVVLAISMLRAALDTASPDSPAEAFSALDSLWIARNVSDSFTGYNPPFLFGPAMKAEAGEAMLALCPLTGRSDCDIYVPSGMPGALEDLGRWKSDEALLVRSADLLEREYKAAKNQDKRSELRFARDYAATLGYANEVNPRNGSAHARRGVAPLEAWLVKYESSTDERELQYIYGHVGEAYGRIAQNTLQKSDAEKAVKFNTLTFEIAKKHRKDGPDWTTMANLGSDALLLAELNEQEAGFQRALKLHHDAYAITQKLSSRESSAYMNMTLARTLQRYAKAALPSVTDAEKIQMLEEAVNLAQDVKPLFEQTGTKTYLDMTTRVLDEAHAQLNELRQPKSP